MVKWWLLLVALVVGAATCGGVVFLALNGSRAKLIDELASVKRSLDAATVALADARRTNGELGSGLDKASAENKRLGKLLADARAAVVAGARIAGEVTDAVGRVNLEAVGAHDIAVELADLLGRLAEIFGHSSG